MKNKVNVTSREFKVFPEKGIVVCTLECDTQICNHYNIWYSSEWWKKLHKVKYGGTFTVTAKAKCGTNDKFDEVIGKRIAESRAKCKAYSTAEKLWDVCEEKILEMANICSARAEACRIARRKEAEHVIELCNL